MRIMAIQVKKENHPSSSVCNLLSYTHTLSVKKKKKKQHRLSEELTNSKGSHGSVLSIDLVDVGHTFGEHIWRNLISKLVSELGCLSLCPADS